MGDMPNGMTNMPIVVQGLRVRCLVKFTLGGLLAGSKLKLPSTGKRLFRGQEWARVMPPSFTRILDGSGRRERLFRSPKPLATKSSAAFAELTRCHVYLQTAHHIWTLILTITVQKPISSQVGAAVRLQSRSCLSS